MPTQRRRPPLSVTPPPPPGRHCPHAAPVGRASLDMPYLILTTPRGVGWDEIIVAPHFVQRRTPSVCVLGLPLTPAACRPGLPFLLGWEPSHSAVLSRSALHLAPLSVPLRVSLLLHNGRKTRQGTKHAVGTPAPWLPPSRSSPCTPAQAKKWGHMSPAFPGELGSGHP